MKQLIGILFVLAVSGVAWTDAHADFLFNSTLTCDSDSDGVYGTPTDATGRAQITPQGAFKLLMSGLQPGQQAVCSFACLNSNPSPVEVACGTANDGGRIAFTLPAAIDPTSLCTVPVAQVVFDNGGDCFTGWGSGGGS